MANSSGGVVPLVGRILISQIFIVAGINKVMNFSMMTGYVAAAHLPLPKVSLAIAAAIEILGAEIEISLPLSKIKSAVS